MATVTAKSLREKTNGELQDQLILEKKKLFDGIVKGASGEAIKAHEKRAGRRLIARIQSILSERNRRVQLDAQIKALTPKAAKADAQFTRLVKNVDERAAGFTSELAKPAGQRSMRPHLKRVRTKHFIAAELNGNGGANRYAVHLAEARRVRAALEREDMGAGK